MNDIFTRTFHTYGLKLERANYIS